MSLWDIITAPVDMLKEQLFSKAFDAMAQARRAIEDAEQASDRYDGQEYETLRVVRTLADSDAARDIRDRLAAAQATTAGMAEKLRLLRVDLGEIESGLRAAHAGNRDWELTDWGNDLTISGIALRGLTEEDIARYGQGRQVAGLLTGGVIVALYAITALFATMLAALNKWVNENAALQRDANELRVKQGLEPVTPTDTGQVIIQTAQSASIGLVALSALGLGWLLLRRR